MKTISPFITILLLVNIITCDYSKKSPLSGDEPSSNEESIIKNELIGYWPFDGNAKDLSGFNHHGDPKGAILVKDRHGNPKSAFYFDGIDDYIDIAHSEHLKPQLPITVAMWIRCDSSGGSILDTNFKDNVYLGVFVHMRYQSDIIMISYCSNGPIGPQSRRSKEVSAPLYGEWFHFIGVIRGPEDMSIYLNGDQVSGFYSGYGGDLAYDDGNMSIGRTDTDQHGPPYQMKGALDEIRIYNYALTTKEAEELYLSGN